MSSKVMINWIKIGMMLADRAIVVLVSLVIVVIAWRKFMLPEIEETLLEAQKTIKTIAGLGGIKRADYEGITKMENAIGSKLIIEKMPELGMIKMLIGAENADMLDEFIKENPTAALQMYEKYKPLLPGASQSINIIPPTIVMRTRTILNIFIPPPFFEVLAQS